MDVYVVIYDYRLGFHEQFEAIFDTLEEAEKYLKEECGGYLEHYIVKWNTKNQERKVVGRGQNQWPTF